MQTGLTKYSVQNSVMVNFLEQALLWNWIHISVHLLEHWLHSSHVRHWDHQPAEVTWADQAIRYEVWVFSRWACWGPTSHVRQLFVRHKNYCVSQNIIEFMNIIVTMASNTFGVEFTAWRVLCLTKYDKQYRRAVDWQKKCGVDKADMLLPRKRWRIWSKVH